MAPDGITRPLIIWCSQSTVSNILFETKQAREYTEKNPMFVSHNFNCIISLCRVNMICSIKADTD